MKFLKAVVAIMTLLPFLTLASFTDSTNSTNSSLPYCNRTDDQRVTTPGEVCSAVFDALSEIDDLCEGDIVSLHIT